MHTMVVNSLYLNLQTLMSACHLHVVTPALTMWVVLCAPVMMDMYWIVISCPVMVRYFIPYTAKHSRGKTFAVGVGNDHSREML